MVFGELTDKCRSFMGIFSKETDKFGITVGTNGIFEANKRFNGHLWDA